MNKVVYILSFIYYLNVCVANNWATYPKVPKTASINGFADPIYALLPECAKECVKFSTGNTPCPYWDTGCFCVMPQWSGLVGQCVAEKCAGSDVVVATSLATSLCYRVGANTWMMPASISTELSVAAGDAKEIATTDSADSPSTDSPSSDSSEIASSSEESSADEAPSATDEATSASETGNDETSSTSDETSSTSATSAGKGVNIGVPIAMSGFIGFLLSMAFF